MPHIHSVNLNHYVHIPCAPVSGPSWQTTPLLKLWNLMNTFVWLNFSIVDNVKIGWCSKQCQLVLYTGHSLGALVYVYRSQHEILPLYTEAKMKYSHISISTWQTRGIINYENYESTLYDCISQLLYSLWITDLKLSTIKEYVGKSHITWPLTC